MDLGLRGRVAIVPRRARGWDRRWRRNWPAKVRKLPLRTHRGGPEGRSVWDSGRRQAAKFSGRWWTSATRRKSLGLWRTWKKRFGRVDICVTNTGGPPSKLFSATTVEDWRLWTDQLLMSTVYFAQETLPRMQKNKWGRFLTITSYSVKQPVEGLLLSNSLRAGVTGLVRTPRQRVRRAWNHGEQCLPRLHAN